MTDWFQTIKNFGNPIKNFGLSLLTFTLKYYLDSIGVINYSTIKYPIIDIKVTVRTNPFWKLWEKYQWEFMCIKHISDVVKPRQVIFDVGSWIGSYTLLFSKLMHNTGQVYAFDCDPKAFDVLRDNLEKNLVTNVRMEKICLSNSVGKADLRFGNGLSESSLINQEQTTKFKMIRVETATIDTYCEENKISPNGIKIDVEGAEGLVIEGCRDTLEKCHPWILLEFHGMFMSEKERIRNWYRIVNSSKKIVFIDGNSQKYQYGSEVTSLPDCQYFHVFIQY